MPERPIISGEALRLEQETVQAEKCRLRRLDEYSSYLCSTRVVENTRDGAYAAKLSQLFQIPLKPGTLPSFWDGSRRDVQFLPSKTNWISQIIKRQLKQKPEGVHWVDVGCGYQIAQREFKLNNPTSKVAITGIDLNPPDWSILEPQLKTIKAAERKTWRAITRVPSNRIPGDATALPFGPADVITAIEVIQYIEDKAATLCHWYNQLAPGGILIIATESSWANWIRTGKEKFGENAVMDDFLSQVKFLAEYSNYERADDIRTLIIFKGEGQLESKAKPQKVWINPHSYKATYYPTRKSYFRASGKPALPKQ